MDLIEYYTNIITSIDENCSTIEKLKLANELLDRVLQDISCNFESDNDVNTYNQLTTCYLKINDIIKEN